MVLLEIGRPWERLLNDDEANDHAARHGAQDGS